MKFGLALRVAFAMAVILAIGVATTGALSIHKFERTLADLLNSRFQFVVSDIRDRIETRMDIGLALQDLEGVSGELEEYARQGPEVLSMEVFDASGTVLFSSDATLVGDLVSEDMVNTWRENYDKESWSGLQSDAGVVGVPIRNNLSQNVGSLVLRYSRQFLDQSIEEQTRRLAVRGIMILAAMAIISLVGSILMLRRSTRDLHYMSLALDEISTNRSDADTVTSDYIDHADFPKFSSNIVTAYGDLETATRQIRKLDEEAAE